MSMNNEALLVSGSTFTCLFQTSLALAGRLPLQDYPRLEECMAGYNVAGNRK